MINASRPFVVNEWITTKIDGVEVTGVVEVGVLLLHGLFRTSLNYFSFSVDILFCLFHFMYVLKQ
jgi:hypothetical protein